MTKGINVKDISQYGNRGPGFGQAQRCDGVKPVNEVSTLTLDM